MVKLWENSTPKFRRGYDVWRPVIKRILYIKKSFVRIFSFIFILVGFQEEKNLSVKNAGRIEIKENQEEDNY